jgi:hypothetical protein
MSLDESMRRDHVIRLNNVKRDNKLFDYPDDSDGLTGYQLYAIEMTIINMTRNLMKSKL